MKNKSLTYILLRSRRKRLGVSQHQLAKLSNVDRAVIASFETGRCDLKPSVAKALWDAIYEVELTRFKELQAQMA